MPMKNTIDYIKERYEQIMQFVFKSVWTGWVTVKKDGATFLHSRCECLDGFLIANSLKVQSMAKLVFRGHLMFLLCNII